MKSIALLALAFVAQTGGTTNCDSPHIPEVPFDEAEGDGGVVRIPGLPIVDAQGRFENEMADHDAVLLDMVGAYQVQGVNSGRLYVLPLGNEATIRQLKMSFDLDWRDRGALLWRPEFNPPLAGTRSSQINWAWHGGSIHLANHNALPDAGNCWWQPADGNGDPNVGGESNCVATMVLSAASANIDVYSLIGVKLARIWWGCGTNNFGLQSITCDFTYQSGGYHDRAYGMVSSLPGTMGF
ncbi:MAG: hypothetical protein GY871_04615 [Actinomycetales bacterium]|nr:hypothetical protein [Actinomycetales bacterium]